MLHLWVQEIIQSRQLVYYSHWWPNCWLQTRAVRHILTLPAHSAGSLQLVHGRSCGCLSLQNASGSGDNTHCTVHK